MVRHGMCDLCKKLHQDNQHKVYENILSHLATDNQCVRVSHQPLKIMNDSIGTLIIML